jgi:hypothetical protein
MKKHLLEELGLISALLLFPAGSVLFAQTPPIPVEQTPRETSPLRRLFSFRMFCSG